jgi:transposase-like protein
MIHTTPDQGAAQAVLETVRSCIQVVMSEASLEMLRLAMDEEVTSLTGARYGRDQSGACRRAGSAPGTVLVEAQPRSIRRPRVRRRDGRGAEVPLSTYRDAQCPLELQHRILEALSAGLSSRSVSAVVSSARGTSRSASSRLWCQAGKRWIQEFRSRPLADDWSVLMIDGIRLSTDQTSVVAMGITANGVKRLLDFAVGSSENAEVCRSLLVRVVERGFPSDAPVLVVSDGSAAIHRAVVEILPEAVIQRCLVHKERNIRATLSQRHHGELGRLFNGLRLVQGYAAGSEALGAIRRFLVQHSARSVASLDEAGDELLTVHSLEVPSTLHVSLLSTNAIENVFRSSRMKIDRVTRFRADTDQAERWMAYACIHVERGLRRIRGHADLPSLMAALRRRRGTARAASGAASPVARCARSLPGGARRAGLTEPQ